MKRLPLLLAAFATLLSLFAISAPAEAHGRIRGGVFLNFGVPWPGYWAPRYYYYPPPAYYYYDDPYPSTVIIERRSPPEYVEKAIADLGYVSDVCVYGIPAESGAPGESDIVAAVVAAPGAKLDVKIIAKELGKTLEKSYIPQYLQVVDEIPKTASGKNLDRVLRDEFSKDADNVHCF